jgi:nucleotide-binding universal stress UspA family protein
LTLVRVARNKSPLDDLTYDAVQQTIEQAEDYLRVLAEDLTAQGFSVQTGVPYRGSAASWILEESQMRNVDLVVMATHDRVGPERWVHGSVAEAVVHGSTKPVMLLRATAAGQLAHPFEAREPLLIVPLDGSDLAETALPFAKELAQTTGARLVLVGVVPRPGQLVAGQGGAIVTYAGSEHSELEAEAQAYLEASVGRVGAISTPVETVVRHGAPATEIAGAAQEYTAAAVVMATHGRTGLVRSILGSVAGGVVHHTSSPVVLIHPGEVRAAEEPLLHQAPAQAD